MKNSLKNDPVRQVLREQLRLNAEFCTECGLCVKECGFLQKYGSPKRVADAYEPSNVAQQAMSFECSLCGLCSAVCPQKLDPAKLFLEMRRDVAMRGKTFLRGHSVLLNYEKRGTSRRYTWYGLPAGCDTVFFPGCALPGTRPESVHHLFQLLQKSFPSLGMVLDCCSKPSHDLGREEHFHTMFGEMTQYLLQHGVKQVLVACPNCYQIFTEHGKGLKITTAYESLAAIGFQRSESRYSEVVTIHDPCVVRFAAPVQQAVRSLAGGMGFVVEEMPHSGLKALCCGEGGGVGFVAPHLAEQWGEQRRSEAEGRRVVTYCAGCSHILGRYVTTHHLVDLLFSPDAALAGKAKVTRSPFTYLNRLRLKRYFRKTLPVAVSRERTFMDKTEAGGTKKFITFLALILGVGLAVHFTGAARYLEPERLRSFIEAHGSLAPLIYVVIYSIAPALFLPGLPLTIAGGLLFGPFWGVVYAITGATLGACIAFLISRYLAREWVEQKLHDQRWRKLDQQVELHGWKVVAFTRLIPLFPFNLLNYAFGLTKVRFSHYAIATFFCMLPACIAFIVFSSSVPDLLKGKISFTFLLGLVLVVLVSVAPFLYKRYRRDR